MVMILLHLTIRPLVMLMGGKSKSVYYLSVASIKCAGGGPIIPPLKLPVVPVKVFAGPRAS